MPEKSAVAESSTVTSSPLNGSVVPADRADAKNRTCVDREVALLEEGAHDPADLTRCSEDSDSHAPRLRGGPACPGPRPHSGSRYRVAPPSVDR